jgi:hypothetical protein
MKKLLLAAVLVMPFSLFCEQIYFNVSYNTGCPKDVSYNIEQSLSNNGYKVLKSTAGKKADYDLNAECYYTDKDNVAYKISNNKATFLTINTDYKTKKGKKDLADLVSFYFKAYLDKSYLYSVKFGEIPPDASTDENAFYRDCYYGDGYTSEMSKKGWVGWTEVNDKGYPSSIALSSYFITKESNIDKFVKQLNENQMVGICKKQLKADIKNVKLLYAPKAK